MTTWLDIVVVLDGWMSGHHLWMKSDADWTSDLKDHRPPALDVHCN